MANASREDLQKLLMDSLKKLKTRDKRIAEMTAASEKAAAEHAQSAELAESSPDKNTAQELQVSCSSSFPFVCAVKCPICVSRWASSYCSQ